MNKIFLGVLAFATGVFAEKKFGVTDRIMNLTSGNDRSVDDLEEGDPELVADTIQNEE